MIFLEGDLPSIAALAEREEGIALVQNPQVKIHYLSHPKEMSGALEELVRQFPSERVEVLAIAPYREKKEFQGIRLKLLRLSAVSHAMLTEALYSHKLLSNLLRNIKQWPTSFFANALKGKFKGIPAIICGAGPSLSETFASLRTVEDKALIFAGGSAIAVSATRELRPTLGLRSIQTEKQV